MLNSHLGKSIMMLSKPFIGNEKALVFHIRITKKCNADCSYCSSWQEKTAPLMKMEDLDKALDFLYQKIIELNLGGTRENITVQYVGGELLALPTEYLKEFSSKVEKKLSPLFKEFKHGGQSNLIGSRQKINSMYELFDGNLGTSFDHFTEQRTIKKDSSKYKTILLKNVSNIKKDFAKSMPGIVVVDKKMAQYIEDELILASNRRSHITLRPVFNGGSPVEKLSLTEMEDIYLKLYDNWFLKQQMCVEPFYSYLNKRILNKKNEDISNHSGCPSQHNCAITSINMDPDGTLYLCQEMSDSDVYTLGNAVKGEWNQELHEQMKARSLHLSTDCLNCSYFKECQGGCMKEAIEYTEEGMYGKTIFCSIWKKLFKRIDEDIALHGEDKIQKWLKRISF